MDIYTDLFPQFPHTGKKLFIAERDHEPVYFSGEDSRIHRILDLRYGKNQNRRIMNKIPLAADKSYSGISVQVKIFQVDYHKAVVSCFKFNYGFILAVDHVDIISRTGQDELYTLPQRNGIIDQQDFVSHNRLNNPLQVLNENDILKLLYGFHLYLSDSLPGYTHEPAYLLKGQRAFPAYSEPQLDYRLFPAAEHVH